MKPESVAVTKRELEFLKHTGSRSNFSPTMWISLKSNRIRQVGIRLGTMNLICKCAHKYKSQLLLIMQVCEGENLYQQRNAPSKGFLPTTDTDV